MNGTAARTLTALEARWGRAGAVHFEERFGGLVAVLTTANANAVVALQGAQVLSFVPAGQDDVLWLSPAARLGTGRAVRGGVPICWPWFGAHPSDSSKPAHGLVRVRDWQVVGSASSVAHSRLVMAVAPAAGDGSLWPGGAWLQLEITLTDTLALALATENRGGDVLAITGALHTYLAVGDISNATIEGLSGRPYIDQLAAQVMHGDAAPVTITGEIDRIYQETADTVTVVDHARGRRVNIAKQGSRSTVVWNPWIEKNARLGDLGAEGYRRMVCVETANAGSDVVTLAAGARHRLFANISVEKIET
ncbi:MAG: D-hexose-6-phosphate mutarotase [Hyphomicrobium sp.]